MIVAINGANTGFMLLAASLVMLMSVYDPLVHIVWGGRVLAEWGVREFAGGIAVHASAGWAALASVLYVSRRKFVDTPHNIPFIALSAGLLWFGWYGFNTGSE